MTYPIVAERVSMWPLEAADVDAFVEYRQDPAIARFQSWETTFSLQDGLDLIASQAGVVLPEPGEWIQIGIHKKLTGELIGDVALHTRDETRRSFEVGFTLASSHQRLGFAREAVRAVLSGLFTQVDADEVMAACDSRHHASRSLLRALGFHEDVTRGWSEDFKGESVRVDVFLLKRGDLRMTP